VCDLGALQGCTALPDLKPVRQPASPMESLMESLGDGLAWQQGRPLELGGYARCRSGQEPEHEPACGSGACIDDALTSLSTLNREICVFEHQCNRYSIH